MLELLNKLASLKTSMKTFFLKYKQVFKYLLIIAIVIEFTWLGILMLTKKPEMPIQDKMKLDSIAVVTKHLQARQDSYDSALAANSKINFTLKTQIDSLKGIKIITKKYYHEVITKVDDYSDNQLDSFFHTRYKY